MRNLLFGLLVFAFLFSCQKEELIPAYVRIDDITLTTDETVHGVNSENITDAWVYVDNQPIGVFELPCVFPVLDEGKHNLTIYPGIKENGVSASRARYPFYTTFNEEITLVKDDTVQLFPSTTYKSNVKMEFLEDFESAGIELVSYGISDTAIQFVNDPEIVKYGTKCGGIFINSDDSISLNKTINNLYLERNKEVYMEIDYRNNNTMAMGLIWRNSITEEEQPVHVIMNPQTTGQEVWKKMYIDLSEVVSSEIEATSYGAYIVASLDENISQGNIFIDNIKIVRFQ